jgi:SAM-dependent methyltransferase
MHETLVRLKLWYNKRVHSKHSYELRFWRERYELEGNRFRNDFYEELMLSIADEADASFLKGKTVMDFGCGPRGSLAWATGAAARIGVDVLALRYISSFPTEYVKHDMIYVTSTEARIPLPDASCDVVYSVNSLDHVRNLLPMCNELRRVLKPGGELIGSFNLNHRPERAEPQKISEGLLKKLLFRDYRIRHWWVSAPGPADDLYRPLFSRQFIAPGGGEAYLWARAVKPTKP